MENYETKKICSECEKEFIGSRQSLTCSHKCRMKRIVRLKKETEAANMHTMKCAVCGELFETGTERLTCSALCARLLTVNRKKEAAKAKENKPPDPKPKKPRKVRAVPSIEIERIARDEKTSYGNIVAKYTEEELWEKIKARKK